MTVVIEKINCSIIIFIRVGFLGLGWIGKNLLGDKRLF